MPFVIDLSGAEAQLVLKLLALWVLLTGSYIGMLAVGGPQASRYAIAAACILAIFLAASPQRQRRWRRTAQFALPLALAGLGIDAEQCLMEEPYSLSERVAGNASAVGAGIPGDPCHWTMAAVPAVIAIGHVVLKWL